ncbi:MAG: alpha/beta hydrolase [Pseudomonadales bacterium]
MQDRVYARPRSALAMFEGVRATSEVAALVASAPILSLAPRGDGQPVLVMPGFGATDASTVAIRQYLSHLGYDARPWKLGRNLGPAMQGLANALAQRLDEVHNTAEQRKVSLVGWSLGGVYARILAHLFPDRVRQVVTLGSPISGSPRSTRAYRAARAVYGAPLEQSPAYDLRQMASEPLPGVPSAAIFSKTDGVVPWPMAVERSDELADNIEVYSSHIGLGFNPAVLFAVADRLALKEGEWQPFQRTGWKAFSYGPADLGDMRAK